MTTNTTTTKIRSHRFARRAWPSQLLISGTAAVQLGAMLLVLGLPALVSAFAGRVRRLGRDERGDAGGKGLIILIVTVIGIGVAVAVGVLIKAQIDKRSPDLDK